MNRILEKIKGDRAIWMVVIFLSIFSMLAVYSSTGTLAYRFRSGNTEYFFIKHLILMALGLVLMFLASRIKYTYYSRISQLAVWIAVPLLVLTLIMGTAIHDAARWLTLPIINISFQSSDLARLALIIYVARLLTKKQGTIKDFKEAFLPTLIPILIITGLILPANFSTAALLFTTCIILMFIGGVSFRHIMAVSGIGLAALALFIVLKLSFSEDGGRISVWQNRIESHFSDSADAYQVEQAKIAIASGGVIGKLPGNSTQRNFLPMAYSDFIYAIIIEEYGLIGGFVILVLYLTLFYRGIRIARNSPGTFGALLAAGLSFSLVFQAMINMAVAVNILPVTGQQLPLISMGGTSLWFTSLSIGIILSVSRKIEENEHYGQAQTTT
ncbi:MAG TPA: FtsW/RodA/SpoVE family cell cycle protein [Bacteroidales bacterium]|nr:FtsW/RodA/SpoVE family cell cycle protein [Bacteroidales bacterium]